MWFTSDSDLTDSTVPGVTVNTEFDTGLAFAAALGYDFNRFRVEGEISYQTNDVDKIGALGVFFDATGDATALSFLINGYFDFVTPGGEIVTRQEWDDSSRLVAQIDDNGNATR